jgi:hypothetical protein
MEVRHAHPVAYPWFFLVVTPVVFAFTSLTAYAQTFMTIRFALKATQEEAIVALTL